MNSSEKAKCGACKKLLLNARFSKTGLGKYRESLRKNASNKNVPINYPTCRNCGTGHRHELRCTLCEQVKELEQFAKNQRMNTDSAKCLDCQQDVLDRESKHLHQVDEEEIMDDIKTGRAFGSSRYSASRVGSRVSKLSSGSHAFETDTNPGSQDWYAGLGEVPLPTVRNLNLEDYEDRSSTLSTGTQGTQGTFHSTNGGWEPSLGGQTGRRRISGASSYASRFVKQGAVPRDPYDKAQEALERQTRQAEAQAEQLTRESSDDEDSEAGGGDDPY